MRISGRPPKQFSTQQKKIERRKKRMARIVPNNRGGYSIIVDRSRPIGNYPTITDAMRIVKQNGFEFVE